MRVNNRLLEAVAYKKYQKYISNKFLPQLELFLDCKFRPALMGGTSYSSEYTTTLIRDNNYVNIRLIFTTNSNSLHGDKRLLVDLIVNGLDFYSQISCEDVEDDIDACAEAFEKASRKFDVDLALDETKLEQD